MFDELKPIYELMKNFAAPWGIAGGWAIDIFAGTKTGERGDVEVAIFRRDQGKLKPYFETHYFNYVLGSRTIKWKGDRLELPIYELQVHSMDGSLPNVEVLMNETDPIGMKWMFRQNPFLTMKADRVFMTPDDEEIPFLAPEIVLLFRAMEHQEKDHHDLTIVLPLLPPDRKEWLVDALKNTAPGHPWIELLK